MNTEAMGAGEKSSVSAGWVQAVRVIQLALPKVAVGWMFALLTVNFNRVTIHELGIAAVLITTMIGMHHFLAPFQLVFGRMADQTPLFGRRRVPYLFLGTMLSSFIFPLLPPLSVEMGNGSLLAVAATFALMVAFGVGLAMSGNAHLALIADASTERTRGMTVSLVWTTMIASVIISASVMKSYMPVYTPDSMQALYNLTPFVALGAMLLASIGIEPKLSPEKLAEEVRRAKAAMPERNPFTLLKTVLSQNAETRHFFRFIFLSIMGIFLQDTILEVFGADVLGMNVKETTAFQQIWGGGVLGAMILMGVLTAFVSIDKKQVAMIGSAGTAVGLVMLAYTAFAADRTWLNTALIVMGIFTGLQTLGAVTSMMEFADGNARATYMGVWGLAMSLGNGLSSIVAGGLVSLLIESTFLTASAGYSVIFTLEAGLMVASVAALRRVGSGRIRPSSLTPQDLTLAMQSQTGD